MLKELQNLFRSTWDAFRTELGKREPEDEVAELLSLMRREIVHARAELPLLADAVRAVDVELEKERRALADCERRSGLAQRIGDAETQRVADEFADRHREHIAVLGKKREAALAEHSLRQREVEEMTRRYKEADANRFVLVAELRRQRAAGTLRDALDGGGGAFGDFSRMEETVRDQEAYADALESLDDLPDAGTRPTVEDRISDIEQRLNELKRRMGRQP